MTLISILIGLGLEYYLGSLDHMRDFGWFDRYCGWLERHCSRFAWWNGAVGIVLTLLWPVLALLVVAWLLGRISLILVFLLGIAVFVYCLGPDINTLLHRYLQAVAGRGQEQEADRHALEKALGVEEGEDTETAVASILFRSHENIFAILFWFSLLGMAGALLYRLAVRLRSRNGDIHGGYAEASRNLHQIMMWPSARLQALSFGLGGSLMHALESWRGTGGHTLDCSPEVVSRSGLGALQYPAVPAGPTDNGPDRPGWIEETRALINRALFIWLTGLGILTIGGFLR